MALGHTAPGERVAAMTTTKFILLMTTVSILGGALSIGVLYAVYGLDLWINGVPM